MKTATLLLLSLSAFAQTKPAEKSAFDKSTIEAYLRNVELMLPVVTAKVDDAKPSKDLPGFFDVVVHWSANGFTKDELVYVSKDGHQVVRGDVYDVNLNPFHGNLEKLKVDNQPSFGIPNAPVNLIVFSDFQCPVCKEEAGVLRQNVATTFKDKVHVYFIDFPLEAMHPWAKSAAIAGRCVLKQNPAAFWDYFDWAYENQGAIGLDNFNSKFQTFATEKKLDGMALGRCIESKSTEAELADEIAEGRALKVEATPTMFLNGRKLEGGIPWQIVEALINMELRRKPKPPSPTKIAAPSLCRRSSSKPMRILLWLIPFTLGAADISPQNYLDEVKYLASPELKGRATGSPELEKAASYIAGKFKSFNLKPADGKSFELAFPVTIGAHLGTGNQLRWYPPHGGIVRPSKDVFSPSAFPRVEPSGRKSYSQAMESRRTNLITTTTPESM